MKPQRAQRLERLVEARPKLEHNGTWLSFDCPIHPNEYRDDPMEQAQFFCRVAIPLRSGDPVRGWDSNGADFDALTILPSIARRGGADGCEWHGFIRDGRFEHCEDSR